jgi:hypothetical protein
MDSIGRVPIGPLNLHNDVCLVAAFKIVKDDQDIGELEPGEGWTGRQPPQNDELLLPFERATDERQS